MLRTVDRNAGLRDIGSPPFLGKEKAPRKVLELGDHTTNKFVGLFFCYFIEIDVITYKDFIKPVKTSFPSTIKYIHSINIKFEYFRIFTCSHIVLFHFNHLTSI
nr:MAG TPA: hypothetical protein [Caudoviricetes sp.]